MQASKIIPNSVYAIRRGGTRDGELVRFKVSSVTTTRYKSTGSPHDYSSTVSGWILEDHKEEETSEKQAIKIAPDRILGPYEEQAELVARKQAEEKAKTDKADAEKAKLNHLWSLLYSKTGLPRPNDPKSYGNAFRLSYGGIDIGKDGIEALIKLLEGPTNAS